MSEPSVIIIVDWRCEHKRITNISVQIFRVENLLVQIANPLHLSILHGGRMATAIPSPRRPRTACAPRIPLRGTALLAAVSLTPFMLRNMANASR